MACPRAWWVSGRMRLNLTLALGLAYFPLGCSAPPRLILLQSCLGAGQSCGDGATQRPFQSLRIADTDVSASGLCCSFLWRSHLSNLYAPKEEAGGVWGHWETMQITVQPVSWGPHEVTCSPGHLFSVLGGPCCSQRPHHQAPEKKGDQASRRASSAQRPLVAGPQASPLLAGCVLLTRCQNHM